MITGAAQMDGAILVVSAADGPMPQTREAHPARSSGRRSLDGRVYEQKSTWSTIRNFSISSNSKFRELLSKYEFPGDAIPIVKGSALMALEGKRPELGKDAILKLMAEVVVTSRNRHAQLTSRS